MKTIVIEGGLGDASKRLYLPYLKEYTKDFINEIYLIDIYHSSEQFKSLFSKIEYVNKNTLEGQSTLEFIKPDIVFIATPPDQHISVAKDWVGKAKIIIIEKPAAISIKELNELRNKLSKFNTKTLFFDHYRLRYGMVDGILDLINEFKKTTKLSIEFNVIEDFTIEERDRYGAFKLGVIYDLLPHFFSTYDLFDKILDFQISKASFGKYEFKNQKAPTKNETFANIQGLINQNNFKLNIGVGFKEKVKTFNIIGGNFNLTFNHLTKKIVFEQNGNKTELTYPPNPYKELINSLILEENLNDIEKLFVDWKLAEKIVRYINNSKSKINKDFFFYPKNLDFSEISSFI